MACHTQPTADLSSATRHDSQQLSEKAETSTPASAQLAPLTLPAFLIHLLRESGGELRVCDMLPRVSRELPRLRKRDGRKYSSRNLHKIVVNVLYSTSAFVERESTWLLDEKAAQQYEATTLKSLNQRLGRLNISRFCGKVACDLLLSRAKLDQKTTLCELGESVADLALLNEAAGRCVGTDLMTVSQPEELVPKLGSSRAAGMLVMFALLHESRAISTDYILQDSEMYNRKLSHMRLTLKYYEDKLRKETDPYVFPEWEEQ